MFTHNIVSTTKEVSVHAFGGYLQSTIKDHLKMEGEDRFRFIVNYKNFTLEDYKLLKKYVGAYGWEVDKKLKNKRKDAEYHVYRIPEKLTSIQKQIDACNYKQGCDKCCSKEMQKNCSLLKRHQERIDYCKAMGISIEHW